MDRRNFLRTGAGATALFALERRAFALICPSPLSSFVQSPPLAKFVTALRGLGPGGIPVAAPDAAPAPTTRVLHYSMDMLQFEDTLHPDLGPTTLWGYNPYRALGATPGRACETHDPGRGHGKKPDPRHLGGVIVAHKGVPIQVMFANHLPGEPILPVDMTVATLGMPGMSTAVNRATVHLHGGKVPWVSDGGPFSWFTPDGDHGVSFLNNQVLNPHAARGTAEYYYPNDQSARMLWYHDHAFGITRLNAYAGLASVCILRDEFEAHLRSRGLPDFVENGGRELPIVIQDKIFVDETTIFTLDPTWPGPASTGSLWYPHVYDPSRWALGPSQLCPPDPSVVPEFFGDTMLVNGTVFPEVTVEARRYRLRILNACGARFLNLQLYVDDGSPDGITLDPTTFRPLNEAGPQNYLQLGTEGGFLPWPALVPAQVPVDVVTFAEALLLGNAERADVIVDFSGFAGESIILYNDAPAPFPMGDPLNDYFPGNPDNPTNPTPGFGPNTRQLMRFKVVGPTSADPPLRITPMTDLTRGNDPLLVPIDPNDRSKPLSPPSGVGIRNLTLNEGFDAYGRLIQKLGTAMDGPLDYLAAPTEVVNAGAVEAWQILNLTGDTHPIHFHLVNAQLLSRQVADFSAPPRGPEPNETGWKETIRMYPGEITTVIMRFDLPTVPFRVPPSPRTGGNEYVWHCHILDHEEHDMMRPLVVIGRRGC